jgi:HTH-type transcriptional regulator, pleiotropic regulator of extracellular virulence genes
MKDWLLSVDQLKQYLYIDTNDFLREKCANLELLDEVIRTGEKIFWQYNDEDRMKITGILGKLYRLKGDFQTALPYLELYKNYCFEFEDQKEATIALIRYAEGLKYAKEFQEAIASFEEALERCMIFQIKEHEDAAWQQLGKCYVEMGNLKIAEHCFLKALMLRKQKNDPKLLEASESVLKFMLNIKK